MEKREEAEKTFHWFKVSVTLRINKTLYVSASDVHLSPLISSLLLSVFFLFSPPTPLILSLSYSDT